MRWIDTAPAVSVWDALGQGELRELRELLGVPGAAPAPQPIERLGRDAFWQANDATSRRLSRIPPFWCIRPGVRHALAPT